jgi:hypothetical protein
MRDSLVQRMLKAKEQRRIERLAQRTGRSVAELMLEMDRTRLNDIENRKTEVVTAAVLPVITKQVISEMDRNLPGILERIGPRIFRAQSSQIALELSRSLQFRMLAAPATAEEQPKEKPKPERIAIDNIEAIIDHLIKNNG